MTLTLTSDDLESHIVVNVSSTLTNSDLVCGCIVFDCGRTDGRTDVRTYVPGLLGHLSGDDIKIELKMRLAGNADAERCLSKAKYS